MGDSNALELDKASQKSWTATLQSWSGESEHFALPIPLDVQIELGLTENSVITSALVEGQLVVSEICTEIALRNIKT